LKDLREKGCIDWLYDPGGSSERSKPAVFFLGTNGIRLMRRLGRFPESELRKRYKDRVQQQSFMTRSLLIADCCLQLEAHSKDEGDSLQYSYTLPADYADQDSEIYDAYGNEAVRPDLIFTKHIRSEAGSTYQTYLLQLFDWGIPRYKVRKRLQAYIENLEPGASSIGSGARSSPILLVACPTLAELIYAKRYARRLLRATYEAVPREIIIRFATVDTLRSKGLTATIWEDL